MKRQALILLLLFSSITAISQNYPLWSQGNARLEPHKDFTKSFFLPLKYTIIPKLELSAYPLAMVYYPNIGIKKFWVETKERNFLITSKHRFTYPTPLQKKIKPFDLPGIFPVAEEPASMFVLQNELLISKWLRDKSSCEFANYLLTWRLGFRKAFGKGAANLHTIDHPILFNRTYPSQNKWQWYSGIDLDAHITSTIDFAIDADFYSAGLAVDNYSLQHKGLILIHLNKNWKIAGGYKMVYDNYRPDKEFNVFPLLDLMLHFSLPKGAQLELFQKNLF